MAAAGASDLVTTSPAAAMRVVDIALGLCPKDVPTPLQVEHVRALAAVGRTGEADALGRSILHDDLDPTVQARIRRELSFAALMHADRAECVTQIQACVELVAEPRHRARVIGELAYARVLAADHQGAALAAQDAIREGARSGDSAAAVAGGAVLTLLDLYAMRMQQAQTRAQGLLDLAELRESADARALQPWFVASLVWLESDHPGRVLETARKGRAIAVEAGTAWALPAYDAATAFADLRMGALDDAAATAESTLAYLQGVDGLGVAVWCQAFLAQVSLHRGDAGSADRNVRAAADILARDHGQLGYEQVQLVKARLLEQRGDPEAARSALAEVWDFMSATGQLAGRGAVGPSLVRLSCDLGDPGRATDTVAELGRCAATAGSAVAGAVHRLATAWVQGDPDAALQAAELAGRAGRRPLTAAALTDAAALLGARGRRADAADIAARAARLWSTLGADADAAACAAQGRMRRPPAPRPAFGIGALTRTERRVVDLVGDGLTNTEIAHRMGISRRTVETHVSSVYRKLDVSTRVAIARLAMRNAIE